VLDNQEVKEPPCPGMFIVRTVYNRCAHVTSPSCDGERQGIAPLVVMVLTGKYP